MKIGMIAFTDQGKKLSGLIQDNLGEHTVLASDGRQGKLREWTETAFREYDGLLFIGAAGIAVRAIAPFIKAKWEDPAVIVIDELGRYVIPILSGHIGGANGLANQIAERIGAKAVITTATDINGIFAIDQWAAAQGMAVGNPEKIKEISGRLLKGEQVTIFGEWSWRGKLPENILVSEKEDGDVYIGPRLCRDRLHIIPRSCVVGIGCRRGVKLEKIEAAFSRVLREIDIRAIGKVSTIDLKADENGLLKFAEKYGLTITTYSADELERAEGSFTSSEFVKRITGVDNVCERSASICAGGRVILRKFAMDGVTMAVAMGPVEVSFE